MTTNLRSQNLEKIAQRAARAAIARGEDFQGAQNEAHQKALAAGYCDEDASDCAREAGLWHGDYEDSEQQDQPRGTDRYIQNNPGYRPCNCEDYPCCGH